MKTTELTVAQKRLYDCIKINGKEEKPTFQKLLNKKIPFVKGIRLYKKDLICGFPIPLIGEIGVISFDDIFNKNLLYRDEFKVSIKRMKQETLRVMTKKEINEYLKEAING